MEQGYLDGAATLASGKGLLMYTADSAPSSAGPMMKELAAAGKRLGKDHPYPSDDRGWIPATLHPAGYSMLLWGLYEVGNYDGMMLSRRGSSHTRRISVLACFRVRPQSVWCTHRKHRSMDICGVTCRDRVDLAVSTRLICTLFCDSDPCAAQLCPPRKAVALPAAGFAAGMAFHFRAEFLVWPFILWFCLILDTKKLLRPTLWMIPTGATMLAAMLPWMIWTYQATGRPMVSTSSAGGSMYESLGEIPDNPWKIVLDDGWVDEDARKRGFVSAWSVDADQFYRGLWKKYVSERPDYLAKVVLTQRLPLALIPPYSYRRANSPEFDFTTIRDREGLTKWGVVQRYPLQVLQYRGFEIAMAGISALLLASLLAAIVLIIAETGA